MPLRLLSHDLLKSQVQTANRSTLPQTVSEPGARLLREPDYFETIDQLIEWKPSDQQGQGTSQASQTKKLETYSTSKDVSKLLVCHDFKGGYTEDPFERGYSFEFWHLVDTFIYFSHKRITLPPRGWVDSGHRHGSKVLGTVIFEWAESRPDLQKCLYGSLPQASTSGLEPESNILPFSTICISQLIKLAMDRKFDGYLINVETDLNFLPPASCYSGQSQKERDEDALSIEREKNLAGFEALVSSSIQQKRKKRMAKNANVLSNWVGWLREEGKRLVGPHWEVFWYDSVTAAGELEWQDALTKANAPFFEKSDGIFTNYTWARPPDPVPPGGLLETSRPPFEYDPALLKSALMAQSMDRSPADVYMGIDVFGRNCYGGYEIGRSLDLIFPSRSRKHPKESDVSALRTEAIDGREDLGLSVALFAPGWTWEREKDGGGERSWSEWWMDELRFWFGKTTTTPDSPDEIRAISRFFGPRVRHPSSLLSLSSSRPYFSLELTDRSMSYPVLDSQPNARSLGGQMAGAPRFYTNFNRGSGCSWWVNGRKVYDASSPFHDPFGKFGWTDIGSSFPKPDRIWPRLVLLRLDDQDKVEGTKSVRMLDKTQHGAWTIARAGLIDDDVWQGGSSLEVVLRPQPTPSPTKPIHKPTFTSLTFLPLCTLDTYHFASPLLTVSLEIIVKYFPSPAGNLDIHDMQLQPYVIWASDEVSEDCSYHIPLASFDSMNLCEVANGWYSSTVTLLLSGSDVAQLTNAGAVVPVVAVGIHLPWSILSGDLRILVGEVFLSALPASHPIPASVSPPPVTVVPVTASSVRNLCWTRVPGPSAASPTSLWGILTWDHEEDDTQWGEQKDTRLLSSYFNIFAFAPRYTKTSGGNHDSGFTDKYNMWLGTSTYEHNPNSFVVAGLEPSSLISGSNKLTEQPISITFGVHKLGVPRKTTNRCADERALWYLADGMQDLEVSLVSLDPYI